MGHPRFWRDWLETCDGPHILPFSGLLKIGLNPGCSEPKCSKMELVKRIFVAENA
jgi:hypothetical protein